MQHLAARIHTIELCPSPALKHLRFSETVLKPSSQIRLRILRYKVVRLASLLLWKAFYLNFSQLSFIQNINVIYILR